MRAYKASTGRLVFLKATQKEYHQEPYTGLAIPCGYCELCREEQARQTAVRITHEATCHASNSFITLTYTNDHLPKYNSLDYRHLVTFWKRLRKRYGKLRYYAVGEYGDKTYRPHYHACLFGHDFTEGAIFTQREPYPLWVNVELNKIWGLGDVRVGALNFETARYTASYVLKKLRQKQRYRRVDPETGELIDVEQPRAFMSRNLGWEWWLTWGDRVRDHDNVIINGTEQKPPKAYDRWLLFWDEESAIKNKEARAKNIEPSTKEETHARARNARTRAERKSKSI